MAWKGIVGKSFSPDGFADYVAKLQFGAWRPRFVVVHNTSAPDTKTWQGWQKRNPPITDEKWAQNLVGYYRDSQGWSSGPHLFVTPSGILVFSPLTGPGTHSPSWNSISWGVETVGEFEKDAFDGPIKTNLVAALAVLHSAAGLSPRPYEVGVRGLHFHKEDVRTTHKSCPGRHIVKADLVAAVEQRILALHGGEHEDEQPKPNPSQPGRKGIVNTDDLNIRSEASARSPSIGKLDKGDHVTVLSEAMNGSTKWFQIDRGYVAAAYVNLT